jgi:hypothetical protein
MSTVRLDAATLARMQDGTTLWTRTISKERAREILKDLKGQLRNTDGSIKPGVLSFSRETGVISTARWWNFGSRSSEKMAETADLMKQLIRSAYGDVYGDVYADVEADLEAYLTTTSSEFGSESFFKLIDSLERPKPPESGEGPAKGAPTPGRLQLGQLEALTFYRRPAAAEPDKAARLQLEELDAHLSPQTKTYFHALLAPRALSAGTTRVLGDGDGSVARMTLMAIHSGRMKLGPGGLEKLATAMNKEAAAGNSRALTDFQSDGQLARDLDEMVSGAEFLPGQGDLIFIGDIMHDRFSCDKSVTAKLVRALHEKGAVFIKGNHDVYDECFGPGDRSALGPNQSGESAIQLTPDQAREVEGLFVHAHYDSTTATFYSHNGVRLKPETENVYQTAFGEITADSPQELAQRMRETEYLSNKWVFTNYRPKDTEMQTSHMGPAGQTLTRDVRFVHGHNENFGASGNVVNVNARQKSSRFAPVGVVL